MFDSLSDRLNDTFDRLRGKGKLTEADITSAMRDIRMALLEADVNFKVVKEFVAKTKERCMTAEVMESLSPAQNVVKIVLDELTEMLGSTESKLVFSNRIPNVIMLVGLQGSGKTTAAGWLLTTIPNSKRIFTIENGSRELELVREENGKVVNSVVHTLTRDSENERQRIDQIALVDICLRFNPDILVVGEMRGAEANAAQEAARVGVAVLTTIHSNSCEATYRRMVSLCKRAVDMSDETLLSYVTEAYPIVVFCKQLENKQRRMMEIMECEILPGGERRYNTLFRYVITENHMEDGKFVIEGHHTQVNEISVSLRKRLLENGMPNEELQALLKPKKEVNAT